MSVAAVFEEDSATFSDLRRMWMTRRRRCSQQESSCFCIRADRSIISYLSGELTAFPPETWNSDETTVRHEFSEYSDLSSVELRMGVRKVSILFRIIFWKRSNPSGLSLISMNIRLMISR